MGEGSPPSARTRYNPLLDANTMTLSAFHVPPIMSGVSQILLGRPPATPTLFSCPPAKNATDLLSGDQKSRPAPSVPATFVDASESIGRTKRPVDRVSRAEYAIDWPSGEIATASGTGMSGMFTKKRVGSGVFDPRDRKSTRLNSSHLGISYAVFCLKKKKKKK